MAAVSSTQSFHDVVRNYFDTLITLDGLEAAQNLFLQITALKDIKAEDLESRQKALFNAMAKANVACNDVLNNLAVTYLNNPRKLTSEMDFYTDLFKKATTDVKGLGVKLALLIKHKTPL